MVTRRRKSATIHGKRDVAGLTLQDYAVRQRPPGCVNRQVLRGSQVQDYTPRQAPLPGDFRREKGDDENIEAIEDVDAPADGNCTNLE